MDIKKMFESDIERPINGVIKVAQDDEQSLKMELSEYVITKELRKHFDSFFYNYSKSIDTPTNNVGVWISGFYGSGKSHFLKILSYLLANATVDNQKTIEYFENKFEDPMMYSTVKRCTDMPTETILFNIDAIGGAYRDDSAILRVFAKAFYNHLGYYGDDLKIVRLESYVAKQGKTDEFRKVFEEVHGGTWVDNRNALDFFEDDVVETLVKVLGMSESSASNWINEEKSVDISVESLVQDIKEYIDSKEKGFRLLFMIDEVGQYINSNVSMKLNLQTITEQLGAICKGSAWVVVTSQEAIDAFAKHSTMDFSGIMGRFNTKLSLTSSSADEVIKKRILKKNDDADKLLKMNYDKEHAVLRNLFTFSSDCVLDMKGFRDENEYVTTYPFVPYQFVIIQKVFDAIRIQGIASKHQSSGERSLLECYQMATQKVKDRDENTLVPFYYFYDTVSNALDTTIRRVIDRCQKASDNNDGIESQDVNVLKLLYLIRYIDDIPSNIDNIAILMIDDIRTDKIKLREEIKLSLDRLIHSQYVARNGDKYNFLTDDEQKVAREIENTAVGEADVRSSISDKIFNEIYKSDKCKYNNYDFAFDKYVDDTLRGKTTGGVRLRIVTAIGDLRDSDDNKLVFTSSANNEAIVVLSENTPYYDELVQAMKIDRFCKQRNISQLPNNEKDIVKKYQEQATVLNATAKEYIEKAIVDAKIFVNGEKFDLKSSNAKDILDNVLRDLIESVYTKLSMINTFYSGDAEILEILNKSVPENVTMSGNGIDNEYAIAEISQWLDLQNELKIQVSMGNVQSRFQAIPYGWGEREIAGVVARLIVQHRIEIRYGGATIGADDKRLVDYLRKRSEIDNAKVIRHIPVDEELIRKVTKFFRDYLGNMSVPTDEVGLVEFTVDIFRGKQEEYNTLLQNYSNNNYPEKDLVISARDLMANILSQKSDNVALFSTVYKKQDDLLDMQEDMENLETFFRSQKDIFDKARKLYNTMQKERDYFANEDELQNNLKEILRILDMPKPYNSIKDLPELMQKVNKDYDNLLENKKIEVNDVLVQCRGNVYTLVDGDVKLKDELKKADSRFNAKKEEIEETRSMIVLDASIMQLYTLSDTICRHIETLQQPVVVTTTGEVTPPKKVKVETIRRYDLIPSKRIQSKEDIDKYVEEMRKKLYDTLENNDVIQIN